MSAIVILAGAFAAGIAVGNFFPAQPWTALVVLFLGGAAVCASAAAGRMTAVVFSTVVFVAGWSRPLEGPRADDFERLEQPCYRIVEGVVTYPAVRMEDNYSLAVDVDSASDCLDRPVIVDLDPSVGRLYVSVFGDEPVKALQGDRVRLRAKVKPIVPFRNRGQRTPDPSNPAFSAFVESPSSIARLETGMRGPRQFFELARRDLASFWDKAVDPKQALLARALTLGEQRALDRDQQERFRRTGTAHLLSVSGLHLALAVMFVFSALKRALLLSTRLANRIEVGRIAALLCIPIAAAFTFLAGCQTPVVRACVMAISALSARAVGRSGGTVEALAVAAAALLAVSPSELFNPGFQLSFAAVIGFVAFLRKRSPSREGNQTTETLDETVARRTALRVGNASFDLARSTLAATAATTPLVLYHFGYFSWVSIFSNMLAIPFTGLLILPGLLVVSALAPLAPDLAFPAARPIGEMLGALDWSLEFISRAPCTIENPGPWATLALVAGCAGSLLILIGKRRGSLAIFAAAAVIAAIAAFADPPRFPRGKLTVDFLDVGQGDSILITFPSGRHWLVDSGGTWAGRFDVGDRVVVPTLRALGVRTLDKLILTHADSDHVGGMPAVLRAFDVKEIWENGQGEVEGADRSYLNLLADARLRGIPILRTPGICGLHCEKEVCVRVVHPCFPPKGYNPSSSFNDNSLVLLARCGLVTLTLLGDIEAHSEEYLVQRGAISRSDVIKLAHHGSDTSSTSVLLDTAKPWIAIASVGRFNSYSFPAANVIERLKTSDINLFRTDLQGAVRLITDGRSLSVEGLVPAKQISRFSSAYR